MLFCKAMQPNSKANKISDQEYFQIWRFPHIYITVNRKFFFTLWWTLPSLYSSLSLTVVEAILLKFLSSRKWLRRRPCSPVQNSLNHPTTPKEEKNEPKKNETTPPRQSNPSKKKLLYISSSTGHYFPPIFPIINKNNCGLYCLYFRGELMWN